MPKILDGKLSGKIGRGQHKKRLSGKIFLLSFAYSSLAQSVEHAAVNRRVVSSSLTGGAKKERTVHRVGSFFFAFFCGERALDTANNTILAVN